MTKSKALLLAVFFLSAGDLFAQQNVVYNHYFLNPFLYNPSYVASNGYTELFLNYRAQWAGFEGAPTTATLNFHLPISQRMGFGATCYQDQAGVLKTTTGLVSFGYQIYFGDIMSQHKLAFGLSAGVTNTAIPLDEIENGGSTDLALTKQNTSSIDGQFGFHYQNKNLTISFAIPRIFKTNVVSDETFNAPGLSPLISTISSLSYNFHLTRKIALEPFVLYRTDKGFPDQYEGLGVLRIGDLVWAGGSYRLDYGAAAFFGFNVKDRIKVGYAYEFATTQITGLGNASHEVQIAIRLGRKKLIPALTNKENNNTTPLATIPVEPVIKEPVDEHIAEPEKQPEELPVTLPTNNLTKEEEALLESPTIVNNEPTIETPAPAISEVKNDVADSPALVETPVKPANDDTLEPGYYVVVGIFMFRTNAMDYSNKLVKFGYPAHVSHNPQKNKYIVHMGVTSSLDEARSLRDVYRKKSRYSFRDTWVLTVE
jgi:type IX secretion system PorP/SprF family membrane protein